MLLAYLRKLGLSFIVERDKDLDEAFRLPSS